MLEKVKKKRLLVENMFRRFPIEKPRGKIIDVLFDPSKTKYDINDYIIRSLKSRRTQRYVLSRAKNVLQYRMVGKCVRMRIRGLGTTFKIRNSLSLTVFELNYSIYSRYITHIFMHKRMSKKYRKSAQYYLRKRSAIKSFVEFEFTIDEMLIMAEETTGEVEVIEQDELRAIYGHQIQYRKFETGIFLSAQQKVRRHL